MRSPRASVKRHASVRRPIRRRPSLQRQDLVTLLESSRDRLSAAQRRIADYVLRNYREVGFMGVAELARQVGVSPAGVVRFATTLNYRGYSEFQQAMQSIIRGELRQGERFEAAIKNASRRPLWDRV